MNLWAENLLDSHRFLSKVLSSELHIFPHSIHLHYYFHELTQ